MKRWMPLLIIAIIIPTILFAATVKVRQKITLIDSPNKILVHYTLDSLGALDGQGSDDTIMYVATVTSSEDSSFAAIPSNGRYQLTRLKAVWSHLMQGAEGADSVNCRMVLQARHRGWNARTWYNSCIFTDGSLASVTSPTGHIKELITMDSTRTFSNNTYGDAFLSWAEEWRVIIDCQGESDTMSFNFNGELYNK